MPGLRDTVAELLLATVALMFKRSASASSSTYPAEPTGLQVAVGDQSSESPRAPSTAPGDAAAGEPELGREDPSVCGDDGSRAAAAFSDGACGCRWSVAGSAGEGFGSSFSWAKTTCGDNAIVTERSKNDFVICASGLPAI